MSVMMVETVMTVIIMMMCMKMIVAAACHSEMIPPVGITYIQILFMYIYIMKVKNNSLKALILTSGLLLVPNYAA